MDPLEAIKVTFFQECDKQLAELEAGLLALDAGEGDNETVNAIFRAVHSVKGGAGAFGFDPLVRFAHIFETTLDSVRSGKLAAGPDVVRVMLRACDVLADHVQAARNGGDADEKRSAVLAEELEALLTSDVGAEIDQAPADPATATPEADEIGFTPVRFDADLLATPEAPAAAAVDVAALIHQAKDKDGQAAPDRAETSDAGAAGAPREGAKQAASNATIRVDLERVDRLIDLVGELVINQAMLAQRVDETGATRSSSVAMGLDELEQLTREIQDSVMAIRAQPVKSVFQRMPRLVREIAAATGKQARLIMDGEGTEVDKTVIERLADPITHMLRNAIDHGLETPAERIAAGKPGEGVVRLAALHRSGRIVIEISDDGRGIDRERVRKMAEEKGLIDPAATMSDEEVDNIIFLPGFSTAQSVTDVSGRGVGMDVVKRSIQALGGRITIASQPGKGSVFTLSLPLTLAVLDGMVVTAGNQTLVAPLTAIIETLKPKAGEVRRLGANRLVMAVRDCFVPLIDVGSTLGYRTEALAPMQGVALLVESEVGGRAALLVDAIQGQRQVVIKSLELNFQRVPGIAAATILGDGRVALILDVDALIDGRFNNSRSGDAPLQRLAS